MAELNIEVNDRVMRRRFTDINRAVDSSRLMARLGALAWMRIERRTQRGKDANNTPFARYSKSHAAKRKQGGYQTSKVDLTMSGDMLAANRQNALRSTVTLFFANRAAPKAAGHVFGYDRTGLPVRDFFALNEKDEDVLTRAIIRAIEAAD